MGPHGLGVEGLGDASPEEYLHAAEMARLQHDPALDWDAFVDTLWGELVSAFGFDAVQ